MNYELAKQLKDAGFPQSKWGSPLNMSVRFDRENSGEYTFIPTLSELIKACGDGFRSLSYHSPRTPESTYRRWIAKSGARTGKFLVNGNLPEEAVAKLWLALNKKS